MLAKLDRDVLDYGEFLMRLQFYRTTKNQEATKNQRTTAQTLLLLQVQFNHGTSSPCQGLYQQVPIFTQVFETPEYSELPNLKHR